jgi:hypothetical protein
LVTISFVDLTSGTEVIYRLYALAGSVVKVVAFGTFVASEFVCFFVGCFVFRAEVEFFEAFKVIAGELVSVDAFGALVQDVRVFGAERDFF